MKKSVYRNQGGFSQILMLGILALIAIAIPVSTKLVQQNTENRSQAARPICNSSNSYLTVCSDSKNAVEKCTPVLVAGKSIYTYEWQPSLCDYGCIDVPASASQFRSAYCAQCESGKQKCVSSGNYVKCGSNGKWETSNNSCGTNMICTTGEIASNVCKSSCPLGTEGCACKSISDLSTPSCNSGLSCQNNKCISNPSTPPCNSVTGFACRKEQNCGPELNDKDTSCTGGLVCCKQKVIAPKVEGKCSTSKNKCLDGTTFKDVDDTSTHYKWKCVGLNGGSTEDCQIKKPTLTPASTPIVTNTPTPTNTPTSSQTPTSDSAIPKVSFKFTLVGVTPDGVCFDKWKQLKITGGNLTNRVYKEYLDVPFSKVDGEVVNGLQVFKVDNFSLDSTLANLPSTNNYLKIKGPAHVKTRYCQNNQKEKLGEMTTCNITFDGTLFDFTSHPMLVGDVTGSIAGGQDGIVNGMDYSYIKIRMNDDNGEVGCGKEGDLNLDGVVNGLDIQLVKRALNVSDEE